MFPDSAALLDLLTLLGLQAAGFATLALAVQLGTRVLTAWIGRLPWGQLRERLDPLRRRIRRDAWLAAAVATVACAGVDAAAWRLQGDAWAFWYGLIAQVPTETWQKLGWGLLRILAAAVVAAVTVRIALALLGVIERRILAWGGLRAEPPELHDWVTCVGHGLRDAAWLGVVIYAAQQMLVPDGIIASLIDLVLIYLAVAVGRCASRAMGAVVGTLDAYSAEWTTRRGWQEWHARVRPLAPLLRRCLDYILWVAVATFSLTRLGPMAGLAHWGPRIIQAIGIFFLARVAVALAHLLIDKWLLRDPAGAVASPELLAARQRRATFAPLSRTAAQVAIWVGGGVFALGVLGFDTTPILAGIGALGLVIGLGARTLIEDITTGFCIVYEGVFLVGDMIEVDGSSGTVEAIGFRTTRFRDLEGRVHLMRNGEMRRIINYSRDFTNAVVRVEVGYDAHLPSTMEALAEAGRRTRAELGGLVLADAELSAIEAFNASGMTLRAIIRSAPAKHEQVAAAYRLHLRACLDERGVPPYSHATK